MPKHVFGLACSKMTTDEQTEHAILSQDDILRQTKTVVQGLDTLKADHMQMLASLRSISRCDIGDSGISVPTDDRISVVVKSLEQLELGIGEAQVCYYFLIINLPN